MPSFRAVAFGPDSHEHQLPNLDRRREGPRRPILPAPQRSAAAEKLKARIPGLRIDYDELLQSPKHISTTRGFLSGRGGEGRAISAAQARAWPSTDPHRAIKAFLNEHSPLFGHGAEVLAGSRLKRDVVATNNGLRTVVWEQRLEDVSIYEAVLVGNISRDGELVNLSSQFVAEPLQAAQAGDPARGNAAVQLAKIAVTAEQAVVTASGNVEDPVELQQIVPLGAAPEGKEQRQSFRAGPLPGEARAWLTWLPTEAARLRLCWGVELTRRAGGERYRVLIDAQTGEVQVRQRLTLYLSDASYRVFTSDSPSPFSPGWPSPNPSVPPTVSRSLVTLSALDTNASPIGWISDGENQTRGNNVDAHLDRNGDDLPDLPRPQGTPFRVFDPPLDLGQSPTNSGNAAVVQLFYWCNWMHDRLYELGFTEAAGNFQKDNFGRGGEGNDAIQADAQDGSGVNNANFTPTPDGEPGRIQMFLFNGPDPDRDGDLDAEVILHEYTHGLTTRLVGGGGGLDTLQAAGLGEGWSDFYALALLSEPGDDPGGAYAFGAYAAYRLAGLEESYYYGIRHYPYSTDLNRSPLTFADIDPAQANPHAGVPVSPIFGFDPSSASEVHAQGEVWCAMLWEGRANLIRKHGPSAGNQLMLQLVTDGLKLTPPNPTFTQARDAILLADQLNNQGANYADLWAGFAKRGLGFSAVAPNTTTTSGALQAFDRPDDLFIINPAGFSASGPAGGPFIPACQSYVLTNTSEASLSWVALKTASWLTVSPASGTLAPGMVTQVSVCLNSNALALPLGIFLDTLAISNTVSKVVQTRALELRVMSFASMPFVEDFESGVISPYWSVSGTGPQVTQVTSLNEPHGGTHHLTMDSTGTGRARNELTLGLDLAGFTNVVLSFWARSFGDEPDGPPPSPFLLGADFDGVAISMDGLEWYEVKGLRAVPPLYAKFTVDLDAAIAAHGLAYNRTFRLRFNHVDDFGIPFDGLAFDDISVVGLGAYRLSVEVPAHATEGAGLLAEPGVVRAGAPVSSPLLVRLSSSAPGQIAVPSVVTLPAGADHVSFPVNVLDDRLLDGTVPVTIRAEAAGYAGGAGVVEVADTESAQLTVRLPRRAREGDGRLRGAGHLRSSRRPVRDVVVQLRSSNPAELLVPRTVVLPAGEKFVEFDLQVLDDQRLDGPQLVRVTAEVENWQPGGDSMLILDNDVPALAVQLPGSVGEGDQTLTNRGMVRLSGTLGTNLVVKLSSSNPAGLRVPPSVEVVTGQLEAGFDLFVADNNVGDGQRAVTVRAEAPGFAPGAASITIFDDETPPVVSQPQPADGATGIGLAAVLAWNPGLGNILVNGGFETGDFTGWVLENQDYGSWEINNGILDPEGPETPTPPLSGKFSAVTSQIGGGQHLLYQDVIIPSDALGATLSWSDRIRNYAPYFLPAQGFRVEVRDTNQNVLEVLYETTLGDPLLTGWQRRSRDISRFRGQVVRIAFFERDSVGYFNLHLDDVRLELTSPAVPTTFDVYFGTNPVPGAAQFQGTAADALWPLPALELNTTYYWRILARRGDVVSTGPIWRFTTRGVGELDHFGWSVIPSPQLMDEPFTVSLTAQDDINNTITNFNRPVTVTALPGSGTRSGVVITELDIGTNDRVEFENVTDRPLDLSGWKITIYDVFSWPAPLVTVTLPSGTLCPPGRLFTLNDNGEAPGRFPDFNAGTNINWSLAAIGNPIAVLLRDARGHVVDFVCAGNAVAGAITQPMPIPPEEWSGQPVFAVLPLLTLSLQRVGGIDHDDASDWTSAVGTFGAPNRLLLPPFATPSLVDLTPTVLSNFVGGIWTGPLTGHAPAGGVTLVAHDGLGHFGVANEFGVVAANDVSVSVVDNPDLVILGNDLTYRVTVTNTGPRVAIDGLLTSVLPSGVELLSMTSVGGACENSGRVVSCRLADLAGGEAARVDITVRTTAPGLLTNAVEVTGLRADGFSGNNRAIALTTVAGPSISTTNQVVTEGNSGSTLLRVPVRLSSPCRLPVSVDYFTSNVTAQAGADYVAVSGRLVFAPGVTNLTIDVPILGDVVDEFVEIFAVFLANPINGELAVNQARCRINDDDSSPSLSINDVTVTEGAAGAGVQAVFTVRLSAPSGITVLVDYHTSDGEAAAPADYEEVLGTLSFPPGTTVQTISVPIQGDSRFEPTKSFTVTLFNQVSASLSRATGKGTILDDDGGELDHYRWGPITSPQYSGVPFLATLSARDGFDRPFTQANGLLNLRGVVESHEVTVGVGTNDWEFPLGSGYHDARTQAIYLPAEIGGPGRIVALALQVDALPGQVLSNWTVRLKQTSKTRYTQAAWEADGWTVAYRNDQSVLSTGWVSFFLDVPFAFGGTDPLLVDLSFNNGSYSSDGLCRSTDTGQPRSIYFQTDSAFGDPIGWSGSTAPPPQVSSRVPNLRFTMESPAALSPVGPVRLVDGFWSGWLTIQDPAARVILGARDSVGRSAQSNPFAVEDSADTDGNGLPDSWETRHFGAIAVDPHGDPDADGMDNLLEYRAGTDPHDRLSLAAIVGVQRSGDDLVVRFSSVNGKAYQLERATELPGREWVVVAGNLVGTGSVAEAVDRGAARRVGGFYRIRVLP